MKVSVKTVPIDFRPVHARSRPVEDDTAEMVVRVRETVEDVEVRLPRLSSERQD